MHIAIILFTLGIIMIVAGYTNQISPHCNPGVKVKIVSRDIFDEILYNRELTDATYTDMDPSNKTDSITIDSDNS